MWVQARLLTHTHTHTRASTSVFCICVTHAVACGYAILIIEIKLEIMVDGGYASIWLNLNYDLSIVDGREVIRPPARVMENNNR